MTSTKKLILSNAILWAAAILSAAIVGAPSFYTLIILPVLACFAIAGITKMSPKTDQSC